VGGNVRGAGGGGDDADDDRLEIDAGAEESFDSILEIELQRSEHASFGFSMFKGWGLLGLR